VPIWRWDGKALTFEDRPRSKAEEHYGLLLARQALELDPTYAPAQLVFLSLVLDKAVEEIGVDQPLAKMPQVKQLLATVNPDLLSAVLDRALTDHRRGVILGTIRALGERGEIRAARSVGKGTPPLVRALNYPDRRVRFAAADALLRIPGIATPPVTTRIVEVLRHELRADPVPRAVVADLNKDRAETVAKFVKEAGFDPVIVPTGKEAIKRVKEAADIDIVLVDYLIPDPEISYVLAQLRADLEGALIPIIITALPPQIDTEVSPALELSLRRMAERYPNVFFVPIPGPNALKHEIPLRITETLGKPLSAEERKAYAAEAIRWFKRMATGEVPGYDIRPAEAAILKALRNDELADLAVEAVGKLPALTAQRALAAVLLDDKRGNNLRIKAAEELVRSIQQHSLVLAADQIRALANLFQTAADPALKAHLALVIGAMRPSARRTGEALQRFVPPAGPVAEPTPKPKEAEKEKEKEPAKEKEKEKEKEKDNDK
jgi:CheY-like chemotaxis protein